LFFGFLAKVQNNLVIKVMAKIARQFKAVLLDATVASHEVD
jgi:hypothetical protein